MGERLVNHRDIKHPSSSNMQYAHMGGAPGNTQCAPYDPVDPLPYTGPRGIQTSFPGSVDGRAGSYTATYGNRTKF